MKEIDLKCIIEQHPDCVTNGSKLRAILLDLYPDTPKAVINTLVLMVNSGMVKEIQNIASPTELDKSRWQKQLEDDYGLSEKFIEIGLNTWIKTIKDLRSKDFQIIEGKLLKYTGLGQVVIVPDGVKYIEDEAFKNCNEIESIIIPESVEYIGDYSFENCYNLMNVSIPQSIKKIGYNAFWNCSRIKTTVLNDIAYIGNNRNHYLVALKGEKKLVYCFLPQSTKVIYSNAFMDCPKLKKIKLPQIYHIGTSAFSGCEELETVNAEKCEVINEYAFSYCKKLKRISIGGIINSIGKYAFEGCRSLKEFNFISRCTYEIIPVGERSSIGELCICYDPPFFYNYECNFRSAFERYTKHDIYADYSDYSYSTYDVDDEQDLWQNYGQPSYSYFIK